MNTKKTKILLLAAPSFLFVLFFVLALVFPAGYIRGGDYEYGLTFFLCFLLLGWGGSMIYRVQFEKRRAYIVALILSFFFWIVLRFVKWLPNIHYLSLYADYLYYFPMLSVPIVFLLLTMDTFFPSFKGKKVLLWVLLAIAIAFFVLVLTNPLHFLVYSNYRFSHGDDPRIEIIRSDYGPLHYAALGYVGLLSLSSIALFFLGGRKQVSLPQGLIVSGVFSLLLAYVVLYTLGLFSRLPILRDFALCVTLLLTLLLEALLDTGLIQNNGRYAHNFEKAAIGLGIYDETGKLSYRTSTFLPEGEHIKSTSRPLGDYRLQINEDLSEIARLNQSIKKESEEIDATNRRIAKLIEIEKEEASLRYRIVLTQEIEGAIALTKQEILSLSLTLPDELDEASRKTLRYIEMLLGYMKQKCMLLLGVKEKGRLNYEQASLLCRVISGDIKAAGYEEIAIHILPCDSIDIAFLTKVHDFLHRLAKEYAFSGASIFATIDGEARSCTARLSGVAAPKEGEGEWEKARISGDEDGISLVYQEGGHD